jgi:hypothetical protein
MLIAQKKTAVRLISLDDERNMPLLQVVDKKGISENIVSLLLHAYENGEITAEQGIPGKAGFKIIAGKLLLGSIDTTSILLTDVWFFKDNHLSISTVAVSLVSTNLSTSFDSTQTLRFPFKDVLRVFGGQTLHQDGNTLTIKDFFEQRYFSSRLLYSSEFQH